MALNERDIECVAALMHGYFQAAIAERDSKIEKLAARIAALEAERHIPVASYVSDYPDLSDLCDPYGKLPQTRARHRQHADRMRGYIGEAAFTRIMDSAVADRH